MHIWLSILGIILFIGLILVHEWGHFYAARRNGVNVNEFGLGFPPKVAAKKLKSGMSLSLNILPLGGFVKLKGEHDSSKEPHSFGAASLGSKTKILLAGVGMNLLVGLGILTILAAVGMPKLITPQTTGHEQFTVASDTKIARQEVQVGYIEPNSPAQKSGLNSRDIILAIAAGDQTYNIKTIEQLHAATTTLGGKAVTVTYKHDGKTLTRAVTLRPTAEVEASLKTDNPKGHLGISPNQLEVRRSTWSAPIVALGFTGQLAVLTFQGLGHALGGLGSIVAGGATGNHEARENGQSQASSQVGGPVAIFSVLWGSGSLGVNFVLMIIAILSLTLALMNILPIPALDGGRLAMILVSRLMFKRPLSRQAEERAVGTSMAVLLTLLLLITIVDVRRF